MNCSNDILPLGPIECREIRPIRVTLNFLLHMIHKSSKDMPRKKKKSYRKQELKALRTHIEKQMYAGDI